VKITMESRKRLALMGCGSQTRSVTYSSAESFLINYPGIYIDRQQCLCQCSTTKHCQQHPRYWSRGESAVLQGIHHAFHPSPTWGCNQQLWICQKDTQLICPVCHLQMTSFFTAQVLTHY
jgi:hypothetical protein